MRYQYRLTYIFPNHRAADIANDLYFFDKLSFSD